MEIEVQIALQINDSIHNIALCFSTENNRSSKKICDNIPKIKHIPL